MVLKRTLPSRAQPAPAPGPAVPSAPAPEPVLEPAVQSAPAPAPAQPVPPPAADEPVEFTPSRPDDGNPLTRKVRAKRPRVFEAPAEASPARHAPAANPAVPQTSVDFDKVGDRLSELGVTAPVADTLTRSAAPAAAVAEQAPEPTPSVSGPMPAAPAAEPDWLAELSRELKAAAPPESSRDAKRESLNLPPPPTLPPNLLAGLVEDESAPSLPAYTPAAVPSSPPPSYGDLPSLASQPSAPSQSDVPWAAPAAAKDDWQLDIPQTAAPAGEAGQLPPTPIQPGDIYAGYGKDAAPPSGGVPPWQAGHVPPAELPGPRGSFRGLKGGSGGHFVTTAAVLALVVAGGWWLVSRGDRTQEQLARLTGSLRETTERLPGDANNPNGLTPERTVAMDQANPNALLPPPAPGMGTIQALPGPTGSASAVIDFADVPPTQQNKPIVADGTEKMPEDIGLIASFQKAVAEKKAERNGEVVDAKTGQPAAESAIEKTIRNNELKARFDAELAAYRQALVDAGSVAEAPRPSDFLGKNGAGAAYMGATNATVSGTLLPPPAPADTKTAGLPPAKMYGSNPAGLPVMDEPVQDQPKVRQLSDFDVSMFQPTEDKIRIPKNVRPRMSTSDFPEMDVLSMVPNKGVIAYHNGTEGVLLIGESVDGWQLVNVGADAAEFRNGQRSYYVSANQ